MYWLDSKLNWKIGETKLLRPYQVILELRSQEQTVGNVEQCVGLDRDCCGQRKSGGKLPKGGRALAHDVNVI